MAFRAGDCHPKPAAHHGLPGGTGSCKDVLGRRRNRVRLLPAARNGLLIGLVLCAGMLAGCSTTRLDAGIAPLSDLETTIEAPTALASGPSEYGIVLPEKVAVLPSSYAGPTPTEGLVELASLPPQEGPNSGPARDVFPDRPEARTPDKPARDIVWAAPGTPRGDVDRLIAKYAAYYEVPESLVRRVVKRESNFNPRARNGPYWGLMQILHQTARGMGYKGTAQGLLDAETNLKYAVRYLRGAYMVAEGNHDQAVRFYARGYYYDAKRRGMLDETGLGRDRKRKRLSV